MNKLPTTIAMILTVLLIVCSVGCDDNKEETTNNTKSTLSSSLSTKTSTTTTTIITTNVAKTNATTTKTTKTVKPDEAATAAIETTIKRSVNFAELNKDIPMRNVTSTDLITDMGVGINIGNSLDSCGYSSGYPAEECETYWGCPKITAELIRAYKKAGFKTIRLPVTWYQHIGDAPGYAVDEEYMNRVEQVVKYILDEGMYCILNTHHEQNWLNTNNDNIAVTKAKFTALWKQIAKRFKSYDDHLLFEAYNEILKAERDWSTPSEQDVTNCSMLAQQFVLTIRNSGGNNAKRHIIVSTYAAGTTGICCTKFKIPRDTVQNKLVIEVHNYDPSSFTGLDGYVSDNNFDRPDKMLIEANLSVAKTYFIKKGYPVILGEFGATKKCNETQRAIYAEFIAKTTREMGMMCIWWDNGTDFGLISRNNYQISYPKTVNALVKQ